MVKEFAKSLPARNYHPGLSNETVCVRGSSVSRSFLAEMCDMERLMMSITPLGISLLAQAMQELNMREPIVLEGASKTHWVDSTNLPSVPKILLTLQAEDNDKEVDWLWVCLDDHALDLEKVKVLVSTCRTTGARAAILHWASKPNDSSVISYWRDWCSNKWDDWSCRAAVIQNTHCGGPIARLTAVVILAPKAVVSLLGGFEDKDESEPMEGYLDLPNTMYSDYLQGWTTASRKRKGGDEHSPTMVAQIDYYGSRITVFGTNSVAPSLNSLRKKDNDIHFLITTADMGLKQSVRPVRDHELFALYGFPPGFLKTVVNLPRREKDLLLLYSTPKQTIQRVISVLQMAELKAADDSISELAVEAGKVPSTDVNVVPSFYCSPRCKSEAPFCFATSQVINRWTTIPCPTIDEWKDESSKDPDVSYLMERIEAKKTVALAKLSNKEYYRVWAKNQLEVEDGVLYQWEYPKVARIRQLRRRVVPIGLRQAIYTAYHATPLAGHVGFYKTYWRIAARYYWPSMYSDVWKAVTECGHCILGNNTSHHA
jgi:Integrase zinc binding domain